MYKRTLRDGSLSPLRIWLKPAKLEVKNMFINNPPQSRYELSVEGHVAVADYQLNGTTLSIVRVFVPDELRGKGVAAQVMAGVVDDATASGLAIIPVCSYAVAYLQRHPQ